MIYENHRINILNKHINRWLGLGTTKLLISQSVIEKFRAQGLDKTLQQEDIFFMSEGDAFTIMDRNRQKLFRHLEGSTQGKERDQRVIFFIETAIVAAMPEEIRLSYLHDVFGDSCSVFSLNLIDESQSQYNNKKPVQSIMKENSEAEIALLNLSDNATLKEVTEVRREVCESIATSKAVLKALEDKYPDCISGGEL